MTQTVASSYRVLLIEDDPVCASELAQLINNEPDFELAAMASTLAEGEALLATTYDLLVVDIGLPDGSGINLIRAHRQMAPMAKSLAITVYDDRRTCTEALRAGVDGYLIKTDPNFTTHMRAVMCDEHPLDPTILGHLLSELREPYPERQRVGLTPREQDTLDGLARGLSYREIALRLDVSPHTITDYVKGLYRKLSVNSRSAAVYAAAQKGLIRL